MAQHVDRVLTTRAARATTRRIGNGAVDRPATNPLVWTRLGCRTRRTTARTVTTMVGVVAYAISRTIGLRLMADDVGNWLEPLGIVSVVTKTGRPPWLRSPSVGPGALPPLTSSTPPLTEAPDSES